MPYVSDAQRRWAHTAAGEKALGGPAKVAEWDRSSKGLSLPAHAAKIALGGAKKKDDPPPKDERQPILLIEHGETALDKLGRVHGGLDTPLSAKGREEAQRLGEQLKRMARRPDVLYTSDRKRAHETAKIAGGIAGIPVKVKAELRPLDVGDFSGKDEKQVAERLKLYFAKPWAEIPGGDRVATWRARHQNFASQIAAEARKSGMLPAFVTHSNVIGSLLAKATGGADGRKAMANPPRSASVHKVLYPVGSAGPKEK